MQQAKLAAKAEAQKKESDLENARRNRLEEFFRKNNLVDKD